MFIMGNRYSRKDIKQIIGLPKKQVESNFNFFSFGFPLYEDTFYIFVNLSIPGTTGHEYPDHFENESTFIWSATKESSINQKKMIKLLSAEYRKLLFIRNDTSNKFVYKGKLIVIDILKKEFPAIIKFQVIQEDSIIDIREYTKRQENVEKIIRENCKTEDILKNALEAKKEPEKYISKVTLFDRNSFLVSYVKNRAQGKCELCQKSAPFTKPNGEPYLEVHHVINLSENGVDQIYNSIALCPNCHRELHYGILSEEKYQRVVKMLYEALINDKNMSSEIVDEFKQYHNFENN